MAAVQKRTVPEPMVQWTVVVASSNPFRAVSRARYRTLTAKGVVSKGFTAPVKGPKHGLAGKKTFHSVLAALAVHAERAGDQSGARYLSQAASRLEQRFQAELSTFLLHGSPEDLAHAHFFPDLVSETTHALDGWAGLSELLFASGEVSDLDSTDLHIQGTTTKGERVELLLPAALAEAQGFTRGEAVWVLRTLAANAAIIELLHAINVEETSAGDLMIVASTVHADTDEAAAARYASGPASMPSDADLERIIAAASDTPPRRISVVG